MAIERQIERLVIDRKTGHQSFLIAVEVTKASSDVVRAVCFLVTVSVVRQVENCADVERRKFSMEGEKDVSRPRRRVVLGKVFLGGGAKDSRGQDPIP